VHQHLHDVQLCDEVTGNFISIKPQLVINATGAWIDFANKALKRDTKFIGGTKGSHIIVDNPEIMRTLNGSAIYFENPDGRMCIFAPLGDKVMIGATDIRIDDPDEALCTDDEIEYFTQFTQHVMPDLEFNRSQVVFHFSGVRPLPNSDVEFTGLISRDHSIRIVEADKDLPFPVYSLVGGKWTTFRQFSEETANKALAFLSKSRQVDTADIPIGGGVNYPQTEAEQSSWVKQVALETGLAEQRIKMLFGRYGTRAKSIAEYIVRSQDKVISAGYSQREIEYIVEHEKTVNLSDLIIRRTLIGMLGNINSEVLTILAETIGKVLGWSEIQISDAINTTTNYLIENHGVPVERLKK